MPLGYLDPGAYQLLFEGLDDSSNSCIEIIDGEFDFIATDSVHRRGENKKALFRIKERSEYFLRIAAQEPINITRVELVTIEKNGSRLFIQRSAVWALIITPATLPTDHDILRVTD